MKPVCFSIIVPDGYTHSFAFKEIVEHMMYVMQEHGIPCVLRNNDILPTHINIIFGAHMLDPFSPISCRRTRLFSIPNN